MTTLTYAAPLRKTNSATRKRLTDLASQATGTRWCNRCSRIKDLTGGVFKKDSIGRSKWICLGCNKSWLASKALGK
jgi:hypothetical protein